MTQEARGALRRFLDLEAAVDRDEDVDTDEEDEEGHELFINDQILSDGEEPHAFQEFDYDAEAEQRTSAYDTLLSRVLENSRNTQNVYYPRSEPNDEEAERVETILREPTVEDPSLFRVACNIGSEDNIVFRLMLLGGSPKYQLRSAFAPGHLRGYVYVECSMNNHLTDLLSRIPGIIRTREGLRYLLIELADRPRLLTLPKDKRSLRIGQWVQVLKGQYKGDIALACRTSAWDAEVLLVPRLSPNLYRTPPKDRKGKIKANDNDMDMNMDADADTETDMNPAANIDVGTGQRKRKRKTSVRNTPKLFRRDDLQNPEAVQCTPSGHQFLGRLEFRDGLLFKLFDYSALSTSVFEMPWSISKLFAEALREHNPIYLTQRPRPQEWIFCEGEKVIVCSSKKHGIVRRIERGYVEVEYDGEGTDTINWYDLQKDIEVGHFVTILNGPSQGYEGWVLELYADEATILDDVQDTSLKEVVHIQLNRLRVINAPFLFPQKSLTDNISLKKIHSHPWCGTEVLIVKSGHPRKGEPGVVTAVLDDPTGTRIQFQSSRYNPSHPFGKITVEDNEVVELRTQKPLKVYFNLKERRHRLAQVSMPAESAMSMHAEGSSTSQGHSMTPAADHSLTPAWDYSSRTPLGFDLPEPPSPLQSRGAATSMPTPQHVLLNPRLVGVSLVAFIDNGDNFKNKLADVDIRCGADEQPCIFHRRFKTNTSLAPDWVRPKHPSASNDQGLLVVIEGEHCGKYVRRINHLHRPDGVVMVLAVVEHISSTPDKLTGEELILSPNVLCKAVESEADKKINKNIMTEMRKEFKLRR